MQESAWDSVESKRIYDPFFILGQRGYERFQTEIFLDICLWSPVQALMCNAVLWGHVLLDLRFSCMCRNFLERVAIPALATQCSIVSAESENFLGFGLLLRLLVCPSPL